MASYDVQTPDGAQYTVDADNDAQLNSAVSDLTKPAPKTDTLGGFAKNLGNDVVGNVKGLGTLAKGVIDPMNLREAINQGSTEPIKQAWNTVKAVPGALLDEGKRLGGNELIHGDIPGAGRKLSQAMYDKPLSTGLDVAGLVGGVEGVGNLLGKGAEVGEAEAPALAESVAPKVAEAAPAAAPVATPNLTGLANKADAAIPGIMDKGKAVGDYLTNQFKKGSEKSLQNSTVEQYLTKDVRGKTMRSLGATSRQIKQMGEDRANHLADYAREKGLVDIKTGDIGAAQKIRDTQTQSGQIVGDMRQLATQRGAAHDIPALVQDIQSKLANKYDLAEDAPKGTRSGGAGDIRKALVDVQKTAPTPDAMAKTITDLFHQAKSENMATNIRKVGPPEGPLADVARELRKANEKLLADKLSPQEMKIYHNALEDYGATTQLNEFTKMKYARDMSGRLPPGMGIMRGALQKGLDVVGYRGLARIEDNIAKWLKKNPSGTTTPKELFRHLVDESADAVDDVTGGH
jgi:hypothetical protein